MDDAQAEPILFFQESYSRGVQKYTLSGIVPNKSTDPEPIRGGGQEEEERSDRSNPRLLLVVTIVM